MNQTLFQIVRDYIICYNHKSKKTKIDVVNTTKHLLDSFGGPYKECTCDLDIAIKKHHKSCIRYFSLIYLEELERMRENEYTCTNLGQAENLYNQIQMCFGNLKKDKALYPRLSIYYASLKLRDDESFIIQHIADKLPFDSKDASIYFACCRNFNMVKYIIDRGYPADENITEYFYKTGELDYLINRGYSVNVEKVLTNAAIYDKRDVFDMIVKRYCCKDKTNEFQDLVFKLSKVALRRHNFLFMRHLYKNGYEICFNKLSQMVMEPGKFGFWRISNFVCLNEAEHLLQARNLYYEIAIEMIKANPAHTSLDFDLLDLQMEFAPIG